MSALHRIIQASFPMMLLVVVALSVIMQGNAAVLPFLVVFLSWVVCALALDPRRQWTWRACLVALSVCALVGLGLFCSLIHMTVYPDYWEQSHQPGAMAIIAGTLFLVPSLILLIHLFFVRRSFRAAAGNRLQGAV